MQEIPERISLVTQTETILKQGILRGKWNTRLPGERALCKELQISRGTLRAALEMLAKQNLIRVQPGRTCEIVQKPGKKAQIPVLDRIACLTPDKTWQLAPFFVVWMDDLRARLQRLGVHLDLYSSPRYYGKDCSKILAELVDQNPHSGWLLLLSTHAMQRWFQDRGLPAVVAGSLHDGVRLPSLDTNFRAVGRHAGGMMFARGHRKIALLAPTLANGTAAPGTLEIAEGLREAFAACRHLEKELTIVYHEPKVADVCSCIDRLLNLPRRPTALLVGQTTTLLTTLTHLAQRKIVVPSDLSVVVTHSEPFYAHIVPELSHYEGDPDRFAVEACRLFQYALKRAPVPDRCIRLMPHFIPGKSLLQVN